MKKHPRAESIVQCIPGRKPVLEALADPNVDIEAVYADRTIQDGFLRKLQQAGARRSVPVKVVPREKLARLSGGVVHQGVVAVASPFEYVDFDDALRRLAPVRDDLDRLRPIVLVLDQITDPRNLGAILRSAAAFAVGAVILPLSGSAPVNAAAIKASAGTASRVPVARVRDLAAALLQMKERGYWIVGTVGRDAPSIWSTDWNRPIGLVVGSEESGMSQAVRRSCDELVSVPTSSGVDSLNASVAAGIVLGSASRVRLPGTE